MKFKPLILAMFLAIAAYPLTQVQLSGPMIVADEESGIDCEQTDVGTWDCKENIPHAPHSISGIFG